MKPSTSRCNNLGGVLVCGAWVPLKHRQTILTMHEITVCIVEVAMSRWFREPKTYHEYDGRHGLREWSTTSTGLGAEGRVGSCKGVPQVLKVEMVSSSAVYVGQEWDHCCCWYC